MFMSRNAGDKAELSNKLVSYNAELASLAYIKGRYWLNFEVDDIVHENKFAD